MNAKLRSCPPDSQREYSSGETSVLAAISKTVSPSMRRSSFILAAISLILKSSPVIPAMNAPFQNGKAPVQKSEMTLRRAPLKRTRYHSNCPRRGPLTGSVNPLALTQRNGRVLLAFRLSSLRLGSYGSGSSTDGSHRPPYLCNKNAARFYIVSDYPKDCLRLSL